MKLFVDDIRTAYDSSWTTVRTVTEAIRYIAHFHFEEISLDHDISHYPFPLNEWDVEQTVAMCEETYQPVAYYIAAKYWVQKDVPQIEGVGLLRPSWYPKITIHSSNPRGAKEMHDILRDAGIPSILAPIRRDGPLSTA